MRKAILYRLLEKRNITEDGHWLWMGVCWPNGYPQIKLKGKTFAVHRLSLQVFRNVEFGPNEQANHVRECKYKHCFNPDHLYKGTHSDNMSDIPMKCSKCGGPKKRNKHCEKCKKEYMRKYMKKYYHDHKT